MSQRWLEVGEPNWSNNATIKIFETENDFNEYICSQSYCKSIWISINATFTGFNKKGGEYQFHSITNERPSYRNANNYLAYGLNAWLIISEGSFANGVTNGWFRIDSTGTLKTFSFKKNLL